MGTYRENRAATVPLPNARGSPGRPGWGCHHRSVFKKVSPFSSAFATFPGIVRNSPSNIGNGVWLRRRTAEVDARPLVGTRPYANRREASPSAFPARQPETERNCIPMSDGGNGGNRRRRGNFISIALSRSLPATLRAGRRATFRVADGLPGKRRDGSDPCTACVSPSPRPFLVIYSGRTERHRVARHIGKLSFSHNERRFYDTVLCLQRFRNNKTCLT